MSLPFVSVVMPVRNEGAFISQSLSSVLAQDYPAELMEVIVCDGMSTDETRQIVTSLQREHGNLQLVDNPGKIAPKALNVGKAHAKGEIIARVDGHCVIAPDYLRCCVRHLQEDGVDGVGGPIDTIGQTPVASVIATAMSSRFGVGGSAFRVGDVDTRIVDTIAFPVYTRSIIERAGPYDEQLVRNQDDEYNYRLRKMGARLLLASDVQSKYYSRSSFRKLAKQYFQYGLWKVRVLQKHPLQMRARQFAPPIFVAMLLILTAASPFFVVARWSLAVLVILYLLVIVTGGVVSARREHGWRACLLPAAFAILHLSYGLGFLVGLIRFASGWFGRDTAGEVRGQSSSSDRVRAGDGASRPANASDTLHSNPQR
jgi:cellulose synthase/poly-beta-1,6-N-acetylglucosamine synthase-like glycosyltransferase